MAERHSRGRQAPSGQHLARFVRVLTFACGLLVLAQAQASANPAKAVIAFFRAVEGAQTARSMSSLTRSLRGLPNPSMRRLGESLEAMDAGSAQQVHTTLSEMLSEGATFEGLTFSPPELATKTQRLSDALIEVLTVETQRAAVADALNRARDPAGQTLARAVEALDPLALRELSIVAEMSRAGWMPPPGSQIRPTAIDMCRALQDYDVLCGIKGVLDAVASEDPAQEAKMEHYKRRLSEQFSHFGLSFAALGCGRGDVCGCYDLLKRSFGSSCAR